MTKRLADGTIKSLGGSYFRPDAPKIESLNIAGQLLRLATTATVSSAVADRRIVSLLMFDLDGTLVRTRSGRLFAKEAGDWTWLYQDAVKKVREAVQHDGVLCVLVSNQAVKVAVDTIQERLRQVMVAMKVPVIALAALGKDQYRKPDIGIWEHLIAYLRDQFNVTVDKASSIFIGDAAGRLQSGKDRKPDFAYSDRAFASNVGVPFKTPEEYFLGSDPIPYLMPDPSRFLDKAASLDPVLEQINKTHAKVEILLLMGWPGCGKTTFCAQHLASYVAINQDLLKSHSKCLKLGVQALHQGRSICIDNTNYRKMVRADWVKISRRPEIDCPIRVLHFDVSRELAQHMNCVRHARAVRQGLYDAKIPDVAYHTYAKYYVAPSLEEGFEEIIHVPFVPEFQSDDEKELFKRIY